VIDVALLSVIRRWHFREEMPIREIARLSLAFGESSRQYCPIVYLHYVLDFWFERRFKRSCRGKAYLVRYWVVCLGGRNQLTRHSKRLLRRRSGPVLFS